jgi:Ulp1 family protease
MLKGEKEDVASPASHFVRSDLRSKDGEKNSRSGLLTNMDAFCLKPLEYLNVTTISAAIDLLLEFSPAKDHSMAVESSYFYEKIFNYANGTGTVKAAVLEELNNAWHSKRYARMKLKDHESIVFSIHHINHFYVVKMVPREYKLVVYDSLYQKKGTLSQMHETVCKNLITFLNASHEKYGPKEGYARKPQSAWTKVRQADYPLQHAQGCEPKDSAGVDCGIFVLLCISRLLTDRNFDFDQQYIYDNETRLRIFYNIYNRDFSSFL